MAESFAEILAVGGKSNSLGRSSELIDIVLADKNQLVGLYRCVFDSDPWVRMRAIDAIEKVCRLQPDWLPPYVDRFQTELTLSSQPSIQWHLAQIYAVINLSATQKLNAIAWLKHLLSNTDVDWIVAANAMKTLVQFTKEGAVNKKDTVLLLKVQQKHKSNSVVKRANNSLAEISG